MILWRAVVRGVAALWLAASDLRRCGVRVAVTYGVEALRLMLLDRYGITVHGK